ncbi:MAG: hypothetical protein LBG95_05360 [Treponema sp.]|nr:hypothetical protein [Treponema sp.]
MVLLLINTEPLIAQEPVQPFRAGAGFGCSFTGYRDEVESPINRYCNAFTFLMDGAIEKGNVLQTLNIIFFKGSPEMTPPHGGYRHLHYISVYGGIAYALDYRLWGNDTFPGCLGGAFRTAVYYTGTDGMDADVPIPTGYGLISLDAHVTQKWIINSKNSLTLSMGSPVFGYMVRPAYTGIDELWAKYAYENLLKILTLGKIASFHNYWAVSGSLVYYHKYNARFSPYAGLGFELSRINFPEPRIDALLRINAGYSFTF